MARQRTMRRRSPQPRPALAPPTGIRWRAAIILLAGFLAYANSFSGPFVLDDRVSIVENVQIRDLWRLGSVLFPRRELPTAGRPLVNLSFAVNYALGGLNVAGYHVVNLAFHLLCGLLVFGIVRRTLELPALKGRFGGAALNLGFAVALLWTLHPLNTEAVVYLTQRTELMMALFYLLTLYASIRALSSNASTWRAIAVLSCGAGMLCKESMVTAPVVVVLYDAVFVFESFRRALAERWRFYGALCASWLVLSAMMWSGPRVRSVGFSVGVDPWTYLLNQTVMITQYLRLAAWPRALVANYGWPVELTLREVLPQALFVTALLALTALALVRRPKWGFLGAWFFVTLAPASSIVPIATEVGAERRMYLPLIALVALAVVSASFVKRAVPASGAVVLAVVATLFTLGTFARNREYVSELVLARTILERYPTGVAHHILAVQLLRAGDRDAGMRELRQAIPSAPRAHYTLGVELLKEGKNKEAIDQLEAFLREQPNLVEAVSARQLLGQAFAHERRWAEAIEQEQAVLTMNPTAAQRLDSLAILAEAFLGAENFTETIATCREYLRSRPNDGPVLTRLGIALSATGQLADAIAAFRQAAAVAPEQADAHRNLAIALSDHEDFEGALAHALQVVALRPGDGDAHRLAGRLLLRLARFDEARPHFERSLQIDPADAEARDILRKLQAVKGR
jgi:tetratricopeptide (TPR) repeat protein